MAVLTDIQRAAIHALIMRDKLMGETSALKAEWRQLIDATDDWVDANATAYNSAIPVGIRSKFTAAQKALALSYVALKRFAG